MDLKLSNPWPMIEPGEFVSAINSRSLVEAASRHNLDEAHKFYADF